jgi:hypothetical protein
VVIFVHSGIVTQQRVDTQRYNPVICIDINTQDMHLITHTGIDVSAIMRHWRYLEIFVLLKYYAASSGKPLSTFRDNLCVPSSRVKKLSLLTFEDGTDKLSRNVGKVLPFDAA